MSPSASGSANGSAEIDELQDQLTDDSKLDPSKGPDDYDRYVLVTSSAGDFSFEAPAAWDDVMQMTMDGRLGVIVSTDAEAFRTRYDLSGMAVDLHYQEDADQILATSKVKFDKECTDAGPDRSFDDGRHVGTAVSWTGCDGDNNDTVVVFSGTRSDGTEYVGVVNTSVVDRRDLAALAHTLATYTVAE